MKIKVFRTGWNVAMLAIVLAVVATVSLSSCNGSRQQENAGTTQPSSQMQITEQEVVDFQNAWGDGIVTIGKIYLEKGDYRKAAEEHINHFYNYQEGTVLFKPTLASEKQFRTDFEGALSYFVAGNENYPEDHGFAIKPWKNVRWENVGTKIMGNIAVAMGNYYFTPAEGGEEVKVEYSFVFIKNNEGTLKILLHDSHFPYKPEGKH